jgi:hypothetical protein
VNYHRDYRIESPIITEEETIKFYQGDKIAQEKDYFIFPVSCLIHSGVWLSLSYSFACDPGGWDTSHVGLMLISKKEAKTRKEAKEIAENKLKIWNYLNEGSVYGFMTEDEENGKDIDSCWGFIGEFKESEIISQAEDSIDYYIKKERKETKKKTIENASKTLGQFLASDNETIRRHAIGILKQLNN